MMATLRQMKWHLFAIPGALALLTTSVRGADMQSAAAQISAAASYWLSTLDPGKREKASAELANAQREEWTPVPVQDRPGLTLKEMTPAQRDGATKLLQSVLSERGLLTVAAIIELENVLRDLGGGSRFPNGEIIRDPELYAYRVYGDPGSAAWGWRIEGHHVSIHTTVVDGAVAVTPMFLGSNPMLVSGGIRQGKATLKARQDIGFELLHALSESERKKAILQETIDENSFDILTRDPKVAVPLEPKGLCVGEMSGLQQAIVRRLVVEHLDKLRDDLGRQRLEKVNAEGINKLFFAWAGASEPGSPHYYRLQGKSFLIEYDNSQPGANHIHSVWREFDGDFGRDLLQEHYRRSHATDRNSRK
jgi:hypothetical protein